MHALELVHMHTTLLISRSTVSLWDLLCFKIRTRAFAFRSFFSRCTTLQLLNILFLFTNFLFTSKSDNQFFVVFKKILFLYIIYLTWWWQLWLSNRQVFIWSLYRVRVHKWIVNEVFSPFFSLWNSLSAMLGSPIFITIHDVVCHIAVSLSKSTP